MSAGGKELLSEGQLVTKKVVQSNHGRRGHGHLYGVHVCVAVDELTITTDTRF